MTKPPLSIWPISIEHESFIWSVPIILCGILIMAYLIVNFIHRISENQDTIFVKTYSKGCVCENKKSNLFRSKVCLRIIYDISLKRINNQVLNQRLNLVFCNRNDSRMFGMSVLVSWLLKARESQQISFKSKHFTLFILLISFSI